MYMFVYLHFDDNLIIYYSRNKNLLKGYSLIQLNPLFINKKSSLVLITHCPFKVSLYLIVSKLNVSSVF